LRNGGEGEEGSAKEDKRGGKKVGKKRGRNRMGGHTKGIGQGGNFGDQMRTGAQKKKNQTKGGERAYEKGERGFEKGCDADRGRNFTQQKERTLFAFPFKSVGRKGTIGKRGNRTGPQKKRVEKECQLYISSSILRMRTPHT